MSPRCPKCASEKLTVNNTPQRVACQDCHHEWPWATLHDFSRFFTAVSVENIANADEQVISYAIDRTMDLLFELLTPANCGSIVETIYGPQMSEGVKDIFAGQVEDVLAALRAHAVAKVREKRESIIASVVHRNDLIM
jgi:hypothetical protein